MQNRPYPFRTISFAFQVANFLLLVVLACPGMLGCGALEGGPQRAAVSGRITVDGRPLENGSVQFIPTQGTSGPVAGAGVTDGEYSLSKAQGPVVGTNRVQISGTRKTGRTSRTHLGETIEERVPVVPAQYNTKSTLVREVESGKNVLDFDLTSK